MFNRGQGRLLPTPEARRLFSETEKFMTGVERIENIARAIRNTERGEISVAAFPALGMRVLPQLLSPFLARRPEVRMTILTQNSPDISQSMLARAADFGISLVPSQAPGIHCRPFVEMSMICALPQSHRLAGLPAIDLAKLDGEPMIALGRDDHPIALSSRRSAMPVHRSKPAPRWRWLTPLACWSAKASALQLCQP
ncbi:LysR substrate-binding domain-containing protein [Paracoccus yeei]|uniref:LysR substrate-binding domain-containing protein n=1 Tax=Paracoccus yeei TaxID=147645 RepID=UPI000EA2397A|nr:LysR substrate-binding domain-containing protein [Paracoccus yeei]